MALSISIKISENCDIKHLRWSEADLSKETKKGSNKSNLRISEAVVWRSSIKEHGTR